MLAVALGTAGHLEELGLLSATTAAAATRAVDVVPEQRPGHVIKDTPGGDLQVDIIVYVLPHDGAERAGAGGHPQEGGGCRSRCGGGGKGLTLLCRARDLGQLHRLRQGLLGRMMCRWHICRLLHMRRLLLDMRLARVQLVGIIADPPQTLRR